jgi:hypothetical protein
MDRDLRQDDVAAIGLETIQRAGFVALHQAGIPHDVRRHDGGKAALQCPSHSIGIPRRPMRDGE